MDKDHILHAMQHLDPALIQEAAETTRKLRRLRPMLIAACLCLALTIPAMAVAGNLLVKHYAGSELPEQLADQGLDAYYEIVDTQRISENILSQKARDTAQNQEETAGYYSFDTWEDMEEFLGVNILDNAVLFNAMPCPVELYDANNQTLADAPCHLTLCNDQDGRLLSVRAEYACQTGEDAFLFVTASAVTERNTSENAGSLGVRYEDRQVLLQSSEAYRTASGTEATLISTQTSADGSWDVDGWIRQNGFVLRISTTAQEETAAKDVIRQVLDAFG